MNIKLALIWIAVTGLQASVARPNPSFTGLTPDGLDRPYTESAKNSPDKRMLDKFLSQWSKKVSDKPKKPMTRHRKSAWVRKVYSQSLGTLLQAS